MIKTPCDLFTEAFRSEQNQDFDHAMSLYDQILAMDPRISDATINSYAWTNKGNILNKRGDYPGALRCYMRALELPNPEPELILNNKGLAELASGDHHSALSSFRMAVQRNPKYGWGWLGLIEALIAARRGEEARQECGKFMLACTAEDKELYFKAKRLVDQFLATGSTSF
jgi:tetratricopeptide (TPR) repeat protein